MRSDRAVVADIGGTNARFALAGLETLELSQIRHFLCSDYPTLAGATSAYLSDTDPMPTDFSITRRRISHLSR